MMMLNVSKKRPTRWVSGLAVACALLALPAALLTAEARDGVEMRGNSVFAKLVPAEDVERSAGAQYAQMMQEANAKKALAPKDNPQVIRLRAIATKIIPFSLEWNDRAKGRSI
jgi:hypothetical protein